VVDAVENEKMLLAARVKLRKVSTAGDTEGGITVSLAVSKSVSALLGLALL
jgi:hypothetical protein